MGNKQKTKSNMAAVQNKRIRPAKKAGSWYSGGAHALGKEFETWLGNSQKTIDSSIKAIICPHAGYAYCGPTAAYSYHHVDPSKITRVFILGPDHCGATHRAKHRCMLSGATHWRTPFGDITVDTDVIAELHGTKCFDMLSMKQDANEHSMELIVPFLSFMFFKHHDTEHGDNGMNDDEEDEEHKSSKSSKSSKFSKSSKSGKSKKAQVPWTSQFKIVPIMVGSCKQEQHAMYGQILARYFGDESTLFVISSDFCHWGDNYGYKPFDEAKYGSPGCIHRYIKDLDFMAMGLIQKLDYRGFHQYLARTRNTICGQHPICVLLNIVECYNKQKGKNGGKKWAMKFVDYSQSSKVQSMDDFSVSYAAGILYECKNGMNEDQEENEDENEIGNEDEDEEDSEEE